MTAPEPVIAVVGAGIVGASTALALQRDGHRVLLLDREAPAAGASYGNAGAVVNNSCTPTAMPGAFFSALKMLGRAHSPLSIRLAYAPTILPWLVRFILESRRSRVSENARHLHALTSHANSSWRRLTDNTAVDRYVREGGWLKVYSTDASFAASRNSRELMDANGVKYELLSAADIRELEPHLAPVFQHGVFQRDSLWISDPAAVIRGMVELLVAGGGTYRQFDVQTIAVTGENLTLGDGTESVVAGKAVIAAGARSKSLARQLGDIVPLDTERGYHLVFGEHGKSLLSRPVLNADASFVLVPMESGLRLTSQVEFAGVDAAPDYRKIRQLVPLVRQMLPGIDSTERSVWMGCRPSLPDSLPVIGCASRSSNVLYAFGHQHIGLTLGPATGYIIADLVAGRDPGIDLSPYRPGRY